MTFKRCLLLGKKAMINLNSILNTVHLVKAMVFPVVMYVPGSSPGGSREFKVGMASANWIQ